MSNKKGSNYIFEKIAKKLDFKSRDPKKTQLLNLPVVLSFIKLCVARTSPICSQGSPGGWFKFFYYETCR